MLIESSYNRHTLGMLTDDIGSKTVVGVFGGLWDTGKTARDGAVLGFEDIYRALAGDSNDGNYILERVDISIFTEYAKIVSFIKKCDIIYANCGPWASLLYVVRDNELFDTRIIREVRTIGWIGYIWQEEVVKHLLRPDDLCVYPSFYARDMWLKVNNGISNTVYYPLIQEKRNDRIISTKNLRTVGFFSALTEDKGFDYLAVIITKLKEHDYCFNRIILAGDSINSILFHKIRVDLEKIDIEVIYKGGVSNIKARKLMSECDCIFFLSTSSIETLGRIMIEAYEQGVPVITSNYGAARELVQNNYRIPVRYKTEISGSSSEPFKVGELDIDKWSPPKQLNANECFTSEIEVYIKKSKDIVNCILTPEASSEHRDREISFSYNSDGNAPILACDALSQLDNYNNIDRKHMLDLGGELKLFLLKNNYCPLVSFRKEEFN